MRQRVSFLRTLLAGKPVLALDEPFAALDAITRAEMQGWLAHVLELEPRTVVLVTHDVEEAVMLADRVVVMSPRPGRAVAEIDGRAAGGRAGAPIRPSSRCASRRSRRSGCASEASCAAAASLLLLVLLGAWELYVDLGGVDPLILPAPHDVASALFTDRSLLWSNFLVTAEEVLLGILVAAVAGLALAIAIHFSRTLRRAVYPLLVASQTIPIPMLAPILLLVAGVRASAQAGRDRARLVLLDRRDDARRARRRRSRPDQADADLRRVARCGRSATSSCRRRCPGVFTGARIAVAVAVIGAVFAE